MINKHTPQPWGFSDDPRGEGFYRADKDGNLISKLPRTNSNMRLMAASPDMYDALKLSYLIKSICGVDSQFRAMEYAKSVGWKEDRPIEKFCNGIMCAALAKAEGKS